MDKNGHFCLSTRTMDQENQTQFSEDGRPEIRQNCTKMHTLGGLRREQKRTTDKKDLFLQNFKSIGTIKHTCRANRDTFYAWQKTDPEFIKRLDLSIGYPANIE